MLGQIITEYTLYAICWMQCKICNVLFDCLKQKPKSGLPDFTSLQRSSGHLGQYKNYFNGPNKVLQVQTLSLLPLLQRFYKCATRPVREYFEEIKAFLVVSFFFVLPYNNPSNM